MVEQNAERPKRRSKPETTQRHWDKIVLSFARENGVPLRTVELQSLGKVTEPYTEKSIDAMMAQEWGTPSTLAEPTLRETLDR